MSPGVSAAARRIGFLGPPGTFTEEALLSQGDWADAEPVSFQTQADVLAAVQAGDVELGFVPIENSIEGTVNATLDGLIFDTELFIEREVVLGVHMNLLASPGVVLSEVTRVVSFPHASAQCRGFLARNLPGAELVAANSTADAARYVGQERPSATAALAPSLAAKLYGL